MARRRREQTIFFPWERRGGFWQKTGLIRARPFAAVFATAALLVLLGARERNKIGIRSTRATLTVVSSAVDAYRADHEGKCPNPIDVLVAESYLASKPVDAWGNKLELICPGRRDPASYELMSNGPDGKLGGLDRVE